MLEQNSNLLQSNLKVKNSNCLLYTKDSRTSFGCLGDKGQLNLPCICFRYNHVKTYYFISFYYFHREISTLD